MGEKEDKEKAEKLAAAKKRVAQLQKKKKAAATGGGDKSSTKDKSSKDEPLQSPVKDSGFEADDATTEHPIEEKKEDVQKDVSIPDEPPADDNEALFNDAIKAAASQQESSVQPAETASPLHSATPEDEIAGTKSKSARARQPSLSVQSKMRSTSFRHTTASTDPLSPGASSFPILSPDGDTVPDIYRKQALRLEELERENKRLTKEVEDSEHRWRRSEEELEELREREADNHSSSATDGAAEISKLRAEIASLTRQNAQRPHAQSVSKSSRSGSTADALASGGEVEKLRKEVESKDSTISDMALEISTLRMQLSSQAQGCETHGSQIAALQSSLSSTETKSKAAERELADVKKSLSRASERALMEGTERSSRDTKIKTLEREMQDLTRNRDETIKKAEGLERKVDAMTKLHREAEERHSKKLASIEAEAKRLRDDKQRRLGKGGDGVEGDAEGMDELEDEERARLERKVRELEGEVFELRRGAWRERRGIDGSSGGIRGGITSGEQERGSFEVEGFDEVDLSGHSSSRKRSLVQQQQQHQAAQQKHSGFTQVLSSGLAAFRSSTPSDPYQHQHAHGHATRPRNDSLLQEFPGDDDDAGFLHDDGLDDEFDEAAFASAQREEEARKMVEHVREVKRKLKDWKAWRLDLVEARRMAGAGDVGGLFGGRGEADWFGEIFDV